MPLISLLIPCFNAARFLPALHASIQAAGRDAFHEVICFDDGSTDDTSAVARELGLTLLTPNPNRGVAHARNRLAEAATGDWLHFQDADDPIAPEFTQVLKPFCTDACDVVTCDSDWLNADTRQLELTWRNDPAALCDPTRAAAELLRRPMSFNASIIRSSFFQEIGGCDELLAMWEDADLHFRLGLGKARFRHVPRVLTYSLRRSTSLSHDYRRSWQCRMEALERYEQLASSASLAPAIAEEAERVATQAIALNDLPTAQRALALCRRQNHPVPTTAHPLFKFARALLPPLTTLRWQHRWRNRHLHTPART